jgi:ribosome-associated translation inhibitor RaiA
VVLERTVKTVGVSLTGAQSRRIEHQLDALERRLVNHPDPKAFVVVSHHGTQPEIGLDLRVQVGPLGQHLISHQRAETVDRAIRLAVTDVERQLERRHAQQSGEPTYGVPSRRLSAALRPSAATGERATLEGSEDAEPE